jgi:hypothetical protein
MKYTTVMGSGALICIPSFTNIGSAIQTPIEGYTQPNRQHGDRINLLSFFNKESRLKIITGRLINVRP